MVFCNSLKAGVVFLFCLLLSPMSYAQEQAEPAVTQEQIDEWNEKGQQRFGAGDMIEAMDFFGKAAEAGHVDALAMIGYIYHQGSESEIALPFLEQAAAKGSAFAMSELSVFYDQGIVVEKDPVKSIELIKQAAETGFLPSIVALASAYETGGSTLKVNIKLALELYTKAAEQFHLVATKKIIDAHKFGRLGFEANPEKAKEVEKYYKDRIEQRSIEIEQDAAKQQAKKKTDKGNEK